MPTEIWPRKFEKIGYLNAVYENSYFKPKVSKFKKNYDKVSKNNFRIFFCLNIYFIVKLVF